MSDRLGSAAPKVVGFHFIVIPRLNKVHLKPRWPPVRECAWSRRFYGKIENCEKSAGLLPASTLHPHHQPHPGSWSLRRPENRTGTRRFNTTGYQKYEIYLKKLMQTETTNVRQNKVKAHSDNQLFCKCKPECTGACSWKTKKLLLLMH